MKPVRIGILGSKFAASFHTEVWQKLPGAEVVAIAARNPEQREAFQKKYGKPPDSFAAHAYDAVYLMARAIERGGLNKARIRDALAATREFPGVTGPISFNEYNDDPREVIFARVEGGRFQPIKD
jgi:branched-chain amino acid transport system substrate-binding protein